MADTKESQFYTLKLAGWTYQVQSVGGKITRVHCPGRFAWAEPRFLGDDWLVNRLQEMLDAE
jgi:hypothetical protein